MGIGLSGFIYTSVAANRVLYTAAGGNVAGLSLSGTGSFPANFGAGPIATTITSTGGTIVVSAVSPTIDLEVRTPPYSLLTMPVAKFHHTHHRVELDSDELAHLCGRHDQWSKHADWDAIDSGADCHWDGRHVVANRDPPHGPTR
jgi:hypothetical protein